MNEENLEQYLETAISEASSLDEEQLQKILATRLEHISTANPRDLINLLYRFDIEENKVFSLSTESENYFEALARLFIQRQRQRLESKAKHRSKEDVDWFDP